MRFLGPLLRRISLAIVAGALVAWAVAVTAFPLSPAQRARLDASLVIGIALECLVVCACVAAVSRPLRRALASAGAAPADAHPDADADAARAASAGHRLPAIASGLVVLLGTLTTAGTVSVTERAGIPLDLALAGAAVGGASAILSAMLCYSVAATAAARAFEALGPRAEVPVRGTVRGKILVLGFGLNTIGVLLFAATGYVRYRADVDREYVAAAVRAQESAVAAAGTNAAPELAERVWLVTASPSALIGRGGGTVARYGPGDVPFELARGAGLGAHRIEEPAGWLVQSRTPGGGLVVSWLSDAPLWRRRREFWYALATMGVVVYAATALLAWLAARAITAPFRTLGRAADRIAAGDLTASPPSVSRDEMGQLAADFRRMAQGLQALVVDVQDASEGVSAGAREAGAIGDRVRDGALQQHAGVVSVQGAVEAMEGSIALVSRGVGSVSEYVSATGAAVGELASAYDEVRRQGAELERAMSVAMRDVETLSAAGREAETALGELEALASHAGGTLAGVRASVAGLERAASESEENASAVAEMAERAGGVVAETVTGIETLRAAVSDAHRRITALGRRSDDIDQVVDFISEVAGRTNLLSLNASIIAAQAGEHGKAFGVVADQIRDLASQIARSTSSIGDIIRSVREDVEGSAALVDRGDALAAEGVQLARNSLDALARIRRSTAQGRETAVAIRSAVAAHAQSSREVSLLVESVAEGSRAVSAAVQLVGRSVAGVNSVSRSVGVMADQVTRTLEDQSGLGERQRESLERLERMIAETTRAVESHGAATRRVRNALQDLSHTTREHETAVQKLAGVAEALGSRARALAHRVGRFKV